jgi:hypothetical protein
MISPVTLQISLSPADYRHAREILPHQVRQWRDQVAEILITADFHRSAGRFSTGWEDGRDRIADLAKSIPGARFVSVDYGAIASARVAAEFFEGGRIPKKDFRGGPFYSYFFGLNAAAHDYVFHVDSDIFFGGGSPTWMAEALAHMETHKDVLFAAPLPGPPAPDGRLHSQSAKPEGGAQPAFRFDTMSTRLFLLSRKRFRASVGGLQARLPGLREILKALVEGNSPADLPEHLFTRAMRRHGLVRREFLGDSPGMWSLHPPYRCEDFYARLPELIRRIEGGDIPEAQRGCHDINASLVDWSEAEAALRSNRWWRRFAGRS